MTTINLEEKLNGIDLVETRIKEPLSKPERVKLHQDLERLYEKAEVIKSYSTRIK